MNRLGMGRFVGLPIAVACLGCGFFLATLHPLQPLFVSGVFLVVLPLFTMRPWFGLLCLPAGLPLLNFSPWTGWLIVDESDLLVLAVAAAGYWRWWWAGRTVVQTYPSPRRNPGTSALNFLDSGLRRNDDSVLRRPDGVALLLGLVALFAGRAAFDPALWSAWGWFSGYATPMNALRVGKSLLWVALLLPLLADAMVAFGSERLARRFLTAFLLGSGAVVLIVLRERAFYPGLLDVATPYRTVGPFWEMHHGGAAIDVYLVLVAPLLVWAWRQVATLAGRGFLGLFILAYAYVCLTTFSRGVMGGIAVSLLLLGIVQSWQAWKRARGLPPVRPSSLLVLVLVACEIVLVFGTDSFMNQRLHASRQDFGGRLAHWTRGLGALETPADWLFGIGFGQLPTHLMGGDAGLLVPGRVHVRAPENEPPVLVFSGPAGVGASVEAGQWFALSQRVDWRAGQRYRYSMTARSERGALVMLRACAAHLLYPAACRTVAVTLHPGGWQTRTGIVAAPDFLADDWLRQGHGVFMVSVLTPGATVEIGELRLMAKGGNLLRNGQFGAGLTGWLPQSFRYFLPWHIDNLYVEILIEAGLLGLLGLITVVVGVGRGLFRNLSRSRDFQVCAAEGETFAPVALSCMSGVLSLGLVVSLLDMPRMAMLVGLFLAFAWLYCAEGGNGSPAASFRRRPESRF